MGQQLRWARFLTVTIDGTYVCADRSRVSKVKRLRRNPPTIMMVGNHRMRWRFASCRNLAQSASFLVAREILLNLRKCIDRRRARQRPSLTVDDEYRCERVLTTDRANCWLIKFDFRLKLLLFTA